MYNNKKINNENLHQKVKKKLGDNIALNSRELTIIQNEIKITISNKDWWDVRMKEVRKRLKKKDQESRKQYKTMILNDSKFKSKFIEIFDRFRIHQDYLMSFKNQKKQRWDFFILALAF
jgi:hypothetical protein